MLRDHLSAVADVAARLAEQARPGDRRFRESARWAGILHDLGKYRDEFQEMLLEAARNGRRQRVAHAVYGAAWAQARSAHEVALAVMGHHAGLHNAQSMAQVLNRPELKSSDKLVRRALKDGLKLFQKEPPETAEMTGSARDLYIRMLFSCLIDADRLDCLAFDKGRKPSSRPLAGKRLLDRLLEHLAEKASKARPGSVNRARQQVLEACLRAAPLPNRLYSLTVPTGGGKTLASMAFALKRAVERPEEVRRIIVVIPYLSIIEQNANALYEALGDESIVEHHSGTLLPRDTDNEGGSFNDASWRSRLALENWDAPIIVTTSVRFFESLYSRRTSDLRRIHNIARSVVILDEVQTLPRKLVGTLLSMIKGLAEDWKTTFVFCTATQPAFEAPTASESTCRWKPGEIQPILATKASRKMFSDLRRVEQPRWPEEGETTSWQELAKKLAAEGKALCVVNLKRHARELYQALLDVPERKRPAQGRLFHLSTRLCAQHRLDLIKRIKELLKQDKPCIVVSTQLVEAGVDIDLPVVYRAVAPLDSIIQAAGRADREGKLTRKRGRPAGRVVLFRPEDDVTLRDYARGLDSTRWLVNQGKFSIHDPELIYAYFNYYYQGDLDPDNVERLRFQLDFPGVFEAFELIEDVTRSVIVPYGEGTSIIERLEKGSYDDLGEVLRSTQRFQVGLYPNEWEEARLAGGILEILPESGLYRALDWSYSETFGLDIDRLAPEDLVMSSASC